MKQAGLLRADHLEEDIRALREAYKALFLRKVNMTTALDSPETSPAAGMLWCNT